MNRFRTITTAIGLTLALAAPFSHAELMAGNAQFSAKLYTEGLGRLPDPATWKAIEQYWAGNACNATTLKNLGTSVLTSQEFLTTSPSNQERAFRLYRAVLQRDADSNGLTNLKAALDAGQAWNQVVSNFFSSTEFINMVGSPAEARKICSNESTGWVASPPVNLRVTTSGNTFQNQAQLQSALNTAGLSTATSRVVYLDQGQIIPLTSTLEIPANVTLTTVGRPAVNRMPLLGRLARASTFDGAMVHMNNYSKLQNVWVDGQHSTYPTLTSQSVNIFATGKGTDISHNLITDSGGFTHVHLKPLPVSPKLSCAGGSINDNIVLAYSSSHKIINGWADGISVECPTVAITGNRVVDATDVGIVVYAAAPINGQAVAQNSSVKRNTIFNAGSSAYGGIGLDGLQPSNYGYTTVTNVSFVGAEVSGNTLYTSSMVHMDFGIVVGSREWFGKLSNTGYGAKVLSNLLGTSAAPLVTNMAIAVSGMTGATVTATGVADNTITMVPLWPNIRLCGQGGALVKGDSINSTFAGTVRPLPIVSTELDKDIACVSGHVIN